MSRPTLHPQLTEQLDAWANQLLLGEIGLQDLPPALAAFYHLGQRDSLTQAIAQIQTQANAQIQRLEHECDRLYLAAFNPRERVAELQRRHDAFVAAQAADADLWFDVAVPDTAVLDATPSPNLLPPVPAAPTVNHATPPATPPPTY